MQLFLHADVAVLRAAPSPVTAGPAWWPDPTGESAADRWFAMPDTNAAVRNVGSLLATAPLGTFATGSVTDASAVSAPLTTIKTGGGGGGHLHRRECPQLRHQQANSGVGGQRRHGADRQRLLWPVWRRSAFATRCPPAGLPNQAHPSRLGQMADVSPQDDGQAATRPNGSGMEVERESGAVLQLHYVPRCAVLIFAACVCAMLLACAGPGEDRADRPGQTPTLAAPSPDARTVAGLRALDAYRGMWRAYSAAGLTSDPHHPDLAKYAAGDAVRVLVAGLEANRREGLIGQGGEVELHPAVVSLTPATDPIEAQISDCADTSRALRVKATPDGMPFTDTPGGRRSVSATARMIDGAWKIVSFGIREVGSC